MHNEKVWKQAINNQLAINKKGSRKIKLPASFFNQISERSANISLLRQQTKYEQIRSVLLGIKTETLTTLEIYESEFLEKIKSHIDGTPFEFYYPVYDKYFLFYENNTTILGDIRNNKLCELIMKTYSVGVMIIATHVHNNEMLAQRNELFLLKIKSPDSYKEINHKIAVINQKLKDYSVNFGKIYWIAKSLSNELSKEIELEIQDIQNRITE